MTLKTMQEKSNGAMIAGIGTPWGPSEGDGDPGGYHLVWSRDMYKFANALITAGDTTSASKAVNWLFNVDMDPSTGRFPQNAYVTGKPSWNATQMDEQAMPIILAYRHDSGQTVPSDAPAGVPLSREVFEQDGVARAEPPDGPIADHDLHLASGEENGVLAARRIVPIAETAVGRTREGDTAGGLLD